MGKCVNVAALVLLLFLITLFTGCSSSCSTETLLTADRLYSRTLRSPNYPSNYFNNQECVWRIRADSWRFTVRLYVADISLEYDHDCTYDSLSFYDGGLASNDNLLAKLCGTSGLNSYFYSSGREILVKFKSDSLGTYRGFRLMYKAVRNTTTTTTTTPDHYWPSGDNSKESFSAVPVVGTVAIMFVAIAVVIYYHRKCKQQASGHSDTAPRVMTSTPTATASVPQAGANNNSSSSRSQQQGVYILPANQPSTRASGTVARGGYHINAAYSPSQQEGVYILPANQPSTRPTGVVARRGHTNVVYSPAAGEPLPHFFQPLPSLSPRAPPLPDVTIPRQTADVAVSPPSYNEVMMMEKGTQPPSYEEVGGADTLVMTSSDDAAVRNNSSRHDD